MKTIIALLFASLALLFTISSHSIINAQSIAETDKTLSPYFFIQSDDLAVDQLPLLSTSADVKIAGVIADVIVKQVYKNTGRKPLEAIYIFPASNRAAVYAMTMRIADRMLVAKIEKKEEARKIYEKAKEEGKSTSLLEQQRPNVFQMNVANIMPGDTITVELKYTELLIPTDGVYEFVYPTVVGPRYSNKMKDTAKSSDRFVETPYQREGENPLYDFKIGIEINSGVPLDFISCKTHKVNISRVNLINAIIELDPAEKKGGNRDFIIQYSLRGGKIETGLILTENEDENFFLLMLQPPKNISQSDIPKREYIFIVDVSGSMFGFPLEVSKELMMKLLQSLNLNDKFNVLLFAGSSEFLFQASQDAIPDNIQKALDLVSKQQGGGGTELLPALRRAFEKPASEGYSRTIVILTDGYVDVEKETFDIIRDNLDDGNVFTFGIGSGVNRYIIEGMARVGRGEPFIALNQSDADSVAEKFLKYIQSPVMTDIDVNWGDFEVYDVDPAKIPDVFADRPIILIGKFKNTPGGEIKVTGITGQQRLSVNIPVAIFSKPDTSQALKYLWARNKLMTLQDYSSLRNMDDNKQKIIDIGLKYNLLTNHTSFVAVDLFSRSNDSSVTVKQPLPLPEGVSDYAVGGTAPLMYSKSSFGNMSKVRLAPGSADALEVGSRQGSDIQLIEKEPSQNETIKVDKEPEIDMAEISKIIKYPIYAKDNGIEGKVIVRALINKKGKVHRLSVASTESEFLNFASLYAVKRGKYKPAMKNKKPVMFWVNVPIIFKLKDNKVIPSGTRQYLKDSLMYQDIVSGNGNAVAGNESVQVNLKAYSESGKLLVSFTEINGPLNLDMNNANIISGLKDAIIGMKAGGKRLIYIPPNHQRGSIPQISNLTEGSNLIIEVELVKIG